MLMQKSLKAENEDGMSRLIVARGSSATAGTLLLGSGLFMLAAPASWYASVPGVSLTGPFNQHFVIDVGLAYLVSATGLLLATAWPNRQLAALAAAWPVLHAGFHLLLWGHHGVPTGAALPTEIAAVFGIATVATLAACLMPVSRTQAHD